VLIVYDRILSDYQITIINELWVE